MKKLIVLMLAMGLTSSLLAQTSSDALRFSRVFYGGTARFQGLGGAFGALGADFSALQVNPAGIGIYRGSEFSMGPTFNITGTSADYLGSSTTSDYRFRAGMADIGVVFTIKTGDNSPLKNFNIGFGINRQTDFNNKIYIRGANNESSMLSDWADILNTEPAHPTPEQIRINYPFDIALAYDANLLYDAGGFYTSDVEYGGVVQAKSVSVRGSMNEFSFSFGGNFNDIVYVGGSVGVPFLRYFESSVYTETSNDNQVQHFDRMEYGQEIETYGTGLNFKAGVIVRPAPWVRIGAAVHTPTWFGNMRDNWDSYITSEFYDSTAWNSYVVSPLGNYDYQMVTPFRAIGSVAFLFGGRGLISAEYEYVNYGTARFHTRNDEPENTYQDLNDEISDAYVSPLNLRAGTEWAIDAFRIRGGFGYYGSPYGNGDTGSKIAVSGGVGYRGKIFFTDVSYVWSKTNDDYYLYSPIFTPPANISTTSNMITATFGVKF